MKLPNDSVSLSKSFSKTERIQKAANEVREIFEKSNRNIDMTIEHFGLFISPSDSLIEGMDAHLLGDAIFVRRGLPDQYAALCILHELGHHYFHARCIGYRITDSVMVRKAEREAETFASLILFPSMESFETEDDFIKRSGLPEKTAKLRIQFFRKAGI